MSERHGFRVNASTAPACSRGRRCSVERDLDLATQASPAPTQTVAWRARPAWLWWVMLGALLGGAFRVLAPVIAEPLRLLAFGLWGVPLAVGALAVFMVKGPVTTAQSSVITVVPVISVVLGAIVCWPMGAAGFLISMPVFVVLGAVGGLSMAWLMRSAQALRGASSGADVKSFD